MSVKKIDMYIYVILWILVVLLWLYIYNISCDAGNDYVAWENVEYCYLLQYQPWNITRPVYFNSLTDCERYIKKDFYK